MTVTSIQDLGRPVRSLRIERMASQISSSGAFLRSLNLVRASEVVIDMG